MTEQSRAYPPLNERIAQRREELRLPPSDVAARSGLSMDQYRDLEQHRDEAFEFLDLRQVKQVCDALGLSLADEIKSLLEGDRRILGTSRSAVQRNRLIEERRNALHLSREELGERLGLHKDTVKHMEQDPEFLETWPISYSRDLAAVLSLPLSVLLGIPSPGSATADEGPGEQAR